MKTNALRYKRKKERKMYNEEMKKRKKKTSNDIIAGNGMILCLKCSFIVIVNYQRQHCVLHFFDKL